MSEPHREGAPDDGGDCADERTPASAADTASWAELVADAESIATAYRDEGWTVDVVEPRDVAPWTESASESMPETGPQGGFVALVDREAFDALEPVIEDRQFASAEVYTRPDAAATLALLVELDTPTDRAIVLPLYYRDEEAEDALASATEAGTLQVRLRTDGDDWLTFVHDDPSLFE